MLWDVPVSRLVKITCQLEMTTAHESVAVPSTVAVSNCPKDAAAVRIATSTAQNAGFALRRGFGFFIYPALEHPSLKTTLRNPAVTINSWGAPRIFTCESWWQRTSLAWRASYSVRFRAKATLWSWRSTASRPCRWAFPADWI